MTMKQRLKNIGRDLLHSQSIVHTFLRSAVSSQAASWLDLATGFVLFSFVHLAPWLSTGIGAVMGGVLNCVLNYKFTFKAQDCPWKAVIVKYAIVWFGSIALNAFGTQAVYHLLQYWHLLERLGFRPDGYYATARVGVSLLVSWGWNFLLQRTFVYRQRRFDKTAIKFIDFFLSPSMRSEKQV